MRYLIFALAILLGSAVPAFAQVGVNIGIGAVNVGINVPVYPRLVRIPGYPVYYDPALSANYFFYDGLFWVFSDGNWYDSAWYDGPWDLVEPLDVPQFVLLIPVRYYRSPPVFFRGWARDEPPRWGAHWGGDWERRREGWDHWNRSSVPAPAPLPVYQRQYSGGRYPRSVEQQQSIRSQNYNFRPHDAVAQRRFEQSAGQARSRGNATTAANPAERAQNQNSGARSQARQVPQESPQAAQRRAQMNRQRQESTSQAQQREAQQRQAQQHESQQRAAQQRSREQPSAQARPAPERNAAERSQARANPAAEQRAAAQSRAAQAAERSRNAEARPEPRSQPQAQAAQREQAQAAERQHAQAAQEQQHERESRREPQGRRQENGSDKDKGNRSE